MSSTLTGTQIKNTYQSLLKFGNNGSLDPYFLNIISDGLGNNTPLMLSGSEFATQIPDTFKPYGFWAQLFTNGNVSIGDYSNQFNGTWIGMNDFSQFIGTYSDNLNKGLKFDFANSTYSFGDFNAINSGTSLHIDDANSTIYTKHSGQQEGLYFDFVNDYFQIGDFGNTNNGVYLNIDDDNRQVSFKDNNTIDGLDLNYALNTYQLGKITAGYKFTIDATNAFAQITLNNSQQLLLDANNFRAEFFEYANGHGFIFDGPTSVFELKSNLQNVFYVDYDGNPTEGFMSIGKNNSSAQIILDYDNNYMAWGAFSGNNTQMNIDDNNQEILFNTENLLFQGTNIQSNTSGGNSGEHLVIYLNGTQYKIKLENP